MSAILLSFATLVALILMIGGFWLWMHDRRRSMLMFAASLVILLNLWLWTTMLEPPASPIPDCAAVAADGQTTATDCH